MSEKDDAERRKMNESADELDRLLGTPLSPRAEPPVTADAKTLPYVSKSKRPLTPEQVDQVDSLLSRGEEHSLEFFRRTGVTLPQFFARQQELEEQRKAKPVTHFPPGTLVSQRARRIPREAERFVEMCSSFAVSDAVSAFHGDYEPGGIFGGVKRTWAEARASILKEEVEAEQQFVWSLSPVWMHIYTKEVAQALNALQGAFTKSGIPLDEAVFSYRRDLAKIAMDGARAELKAGRIVAGHAAAIVGQWLEASTMCWNEDARTAANLAAGIIEDILNRFEG